MGITPLFAHVADVGVFPLKDPHILQLGMIGSRASINYGADILIEAPGIRGNTYEDIANFDHYDMIIGTPFMHTNKVILDFESNIGDVQSHWNTPRTQARSPIAQATQSIAVV